jgi:hypothetical protein
VKDVCGDDRPQLFILLEGGAEFRVGMGLSERVGKVTGGLEYLFPAVVGRRRKSSGACPYAHPTCSSLGKRPQRAHEMDSAILN